MNVPHVQCPVEEVLHTDPHLLRLGLLKLLSELVGKKEMDDERPISMSLVGRSTLLEYLAFFGINPQLPQSTLQYSLLETLAEEVAQLCKNLLSPQIAQIDAIPTETATSSPRKPTNLIAGLCWMLKFQCGMEAYDIPEHLTIFLASNPTWQGLIQQQAQC